MIVFMIWYCFFSLCIAIGFAEQDLKTLKMRPFGKAIVFIIVTVMAFVYWPVLLGSVIHKLYHS